MAGLGRWRAHVPGIVFITSAYYLTLIYARGDWNEFLAVSAIPLLGASLLSVVRSSKLQLAPMLALALSCIVFVGSHNLTLVWGATWMALLALMSLVFVPDVRSWITRAGLLRVTGVIVPAVLVNAWFLLPAIVYQTHTAIGSRYLHWRLVLSEVMFMVSASHLFAFSRISALPPDRTFTLVLPVLVICWTLVGLLMFVIMRPRAPWTRMLAVLLAITLLVGMMMTHAGLVLALPRPYAMLQFSYRLESYVLLGISGAVLCLLVLARADGRLTKLWIGSLAPVLILSIVAAILQVGNYLPRGSRATAMTVKSKPGPTEAGGVYDYGNGTLAPYFGRAPEIDFAVDAVRGDHVTKTIHRRPGELLSTNIGGGPELVHVTGARIVGVTPTRNDVIEVGPSVQEGRSQHRRRVRWTEVITLSGASSWPVAVGRACSVLGAVLLLGELLMLVVWRVRSGAPAGRQ